MNRAEPRLTPITSAEIRKLAAQDPDRFRAVFPTVPSEVLVALRADPLEQADLNRVLADLKIHQVELEIQNEELIGARAEAEAERRRYADLYDRAPVG